jgi:hypothetical protein
MIALALTVLGASLLGSLHCAAMCGGFVAFYAGDSPRRGGAIAGHFSYNAGRILAYATLGALGGALGAALDLGGAQVGLHRVAAIVAGALITLWGIATLLGALGLRTLRIEPHHALGRLVGRGVALVARRELRTRAFVIGLLTGGLPCGWLYAFVVTAAGTGSAAAGAGLMAVFWLGTLPPMVGLGLGLRALAGPLGRRLPAVCALAMIVVGLLAVAGRMAQAPTPAAQVESRSHAGH